MKTLIIGIVIGAACSWLYGQVKATKTINGLGRFLFIAGIASIAFGIDTFTGSLIEHEIQAAWMGLGLFGVVTAVLFVVGRRYGVNQET